MSRLEDELRMALRREEPPPGFAFRVLGRVGSRSDIRPAARRPFAPLWIAACLTVAVILPFASFEYRRERDERRAGELARQRVFVALRIASSKLNYAQRKVREIGDSGEPR